MLALNSFSILGLQFHIHSSVSTQTLLLEAYPHGMTLFLKYQIVIFWHTPRHASINHNPQSRQSSTCCLRDIPISQLVTQQHQSTSDWKAPQFDPYCKQWVCWGKLGWIGDLEHCLTTQLLHQRTQQTTLLPSLPAPGKDTSLVKMWWRLEHCFFNGHYYFWHNYFQQLLVSKLKMFINHSSVHVFGGWWYNYIWPHTGWVACFWRIIHWR